MTPFDDGEAREAARRFRSEGIDTIGVCFLHSYANPAHELPMRKILAKEHPNAIMSILAQVHREDRVYERPTTTLCRRRRPAEGRGVGRADQAAPRREHRRRTVLRHEVLARQAVDQLEVGVIVEPE